MSPQRPATVTASMWLTVGMLAVSGISALLTLVYKDELLSSWREGRDDSSSVQQPAFVAVALVMFVVVAMFVGVLLMFFRDGHNWARMLLGALVVLLVVALIGILRTQPPALFVALCVLTILLNLATLGCLLHKDTRAWFAAAATA